MEELTGLWSVFPPSLILVCSFEVMLTFVVLDFVVVS
jgi:hypothetical protein